MEKLGIFAISEIMKKGKPTNFEDAVLRSEHGCPPLFNYPKLTMLFYELLLLWKQYLKLA